MSENSIFWLYNIEILWKDDNYLRLLPSENMSKIEKFNAISRLLIYHIIIILVFKLDIKYLYIELFEFFS